MSILTYCHIHIHILLCKCSFHWGMCNYLHFILYTWGNWGLGRFNSFLMVVLLVVTGGVRIRTLGFEIHCVSHFFLSFLSFFFLLNMPSLLYILSLLPSISPLILVIQSLETGALHLTFKDRTWKNTYFLYWITLKNTAVEIRVWIRDFSA